jgi:hypothetical protein
MNALVDLWMSSDENLFHIVQSDDLVLHQSEETVWFQLIRDLFQNYKQFHSIAVLYYRSLSLFNEKAITGHRQRKKDREETDESKQEGRLRLLFDRPTAGNENTTKLFPTISPPAAPPLKDENEIQPGRVPSRLAGRKPKDFYSMYAAFCGTQAMGMDAIPENVYNNLTGNPSFARACNFTQPTPNSVASTDIPSLRKLEQFDQIMTENGLWSEAKDKTIIQNFNQKIIVPEKNLVQDTTHHFAFSGFETVHYSDKNGKPCKKSQCYISKTCSCDDKNSCSHPWELVDEGAGTVVKKHNVFYWAHKSSIIGLPDQGVPLIAQAMTDAAGHDSSSPMESLSLLNKHLPKVVEKAENLLDDSAADDPKLKEAIRKTFQLDLRCHVNPRRRKTLGSDDLPKGMLSLTATGTLRCQAGHEMTYRCIRQGLGYYYDSPTDELQKDLCSSCPFKPECCHMDNTKGRNVIIPFDKLPAISPQDPPMAKRFQTLMKKRPSVERMIYRLKCTLGDRYLSKRGNHNYQASLDKAMLAFHLLLRQ